MDSREQRVLIRVLAAIQFTHIMDFMIMMPLGPKLMQLFAIDALQFAALVSAYTAASALACVLSAVLLDSFDRRAALLFGYALFALATLACALAESYWQLMAARFLAGFFGGMIGVVVVTIVTDVVPFERRGYAMGQLMAAFSVATVAGVPVGLLAANAVGWHAPFFLLALFSAAIWVLAYQRVPSLSAHRNGAQTSALRSFVAVLSQGRYWLAYLFTFFMVFTGFVVIPFITLHLQSNVGLGAEQIPIIYFAGGVATLISSPLVGWLSDRFGKTPTFSALALAACVPIALLTQLESQDWLPLLMITTLFFVLVSGRMIPAMAMVSAVPEAKQRGAYMSLNNAVQSAAMALAALVGGWLARCENGDLCNYASNGYASMATSLVSIALLWLVLRTINLHKGRAA